MKTIVGNLWRFLLSLAILLCLPSVVFADNGHDWMVGDLRVDLPTVSNSMDYRVWIIGEGPANTWDTTTSFTTGWLSVYLPVFFQVGVIVNNQGYHWFAMAASSQITRLQGTVWVTTPPYAGCMGDANVWVSRGQIQEFELVSYGTGLWIARVYEANGIGHDVAELSSSSQAITASTASFEQWWGGYSADPYLAAIFAFSHPQYMIWGNGFQEWPNSTDTQQSYIYPDSTTSTSFCPTNYGAIWDFQNDPRTWYAGTSQSGENMVCQAVLFLFDYLPLIEKS